MTKTHCKSVREAIPKLQGVTLNYAAHDIEATALLGDDCRFLPA